MTPTKRISLGPTMAKQQITMTRLLRRQKVIQQQTAKSSEILMVSKQQYIDALHQLKQAHDREIAERDAAYAVAMERLQNLRAAFDRLLEGIQKAQKLVRDTFDHEGFDNPELKQLLSDLLAPGSRERG